MNERYNTFRRELRDQTGKIPMKDYCIRKAEQLVLDKNRTLIIMFDFEFIETAVEDKLYAYWTKHRTLGPNHRWNCIEGDLNGEWMEIHWAGKGGYPALNENSPCGS
tara:strand:+ start:2139 stop:2459 length:321 start_codon:yes stop_codon:yes gene_type:complete